jgi:EF-P beta-lysylation protein EpmB
MIPLTASICQSDDEESAQIDGWQAELARAINQPHELLAVLGLSATDIVGGIEEGHNFPLRVPRGYVARMQSGDASDPLLLQVLPRRLESAAQPGFLRDPVGDDAAAVRPGLLHKYHGRVLLVATGACPIHCRYCFRRHFPYAEHRPDDRHWQSSVDYIAAHPEVNEVILSGGDPLSLSTQRLRDITNALRDIPHLQRLRIHSRMPIVLPQRIDTAFLAWLAELPWQTVLVNHCNHANEIDAGVQKALAALQQRGVTLLNQAVLLKDVNDNADALCALSEALFASGVLPYYLHLLDPVQGAAHFDVDENTATAIIAALRSRLPGYLVPQLVREQAGAPNKTPITQR